MSIVEVEDMLEEIDAMKEDSIPSEVLVTQIVFRDPWSS